jgi:glycosyltransferase involved in cell wall biosynthesis
MVSEFDLGLISLDARLTSHNYPGKLLSYLYWGKPVLASVNPGNDLLGLLQESGAGFCFLNGDDENLALAALRLADDAELRSDMGRNARQLLEQTFSVEHAVNQIFDHLHEAQLIARSERPKQSVLADPRIQSAELADRSDAY